MKREKKKKSAPELQETLGCAAGEEPQPQKKPPVLSLTPLHSPSPSLSFACQGAGDNEWDALVVIETPWQPSTFRKHHSNCGHCSRVESHPLSYIPTSKCCFTTTLPGTHRKWKISYRASCSEHGSRRGGKQVGSDERMGSRTETERPQNRQGLGELYIHLRVKCVTVYQQVMKSTVCSSSSSQTPSKVATSYSPVSDWKQSAKLESQLHYLPACDLYTNLSISLNLSFPSSAGKKKCSCAIFFSMTWMARWTSFGFSTQEDEAGGLLRVWG